MCAIAARNSYKACQLRGAQNSRYSDAESIRAANYARLVYVYPFLFCARALDRAHPYGCEKLHQLFYTDGRLSFRFARPCERMLLGIAFARGLQTFGTCMRAELACLKYVKSSVIFQWACATDPRCKSSSILARVYGIAKI